MVWTDKSGIAQNSKIVLTISNWHFNRDTLKDAVGPTCKIENVMVTLKLSSSVFEASNSTAGAASGSSNETELAGEKDDSSSNGGDRAVVSRSGDVFHFDKNGCIIPFPAFIELLDDKEFEDYLRHVKDKYNSKESETTGPKTPPRLSSDNFRELDDNELNDLKTSLAKKHKMNVIYGRAKKAAIEFANENVYVPIPVDFPSSQGRVRDLDDDDEEEDVGSKTSGVGGGSLEESEEKTGKGNRRRGVKK